MIQIGVTKRRLKDAKGEIERLTKEIEQKNKIITKLRKKAPENGPEADTNIILHDDQNRAYYEYANYEEMPLARMIELDKVQKLAQLGLTPELMDAYDEEFWGHFNSAKGCDIGQIAVMWSKMKERASIGTGPMYVMRCAAVCVIREDENPKNFSGQIAAEKLNYWRTQPDIIDFFLGDWAKKFVKVGIQSADKLRTFLGERETSLRALTPEAWRMQFSPWLDKLTDLSTEFPGVTSSKSKQ